MKKSNPTITLNNLCIKEREICPAYASKINSIWEKQIILLMILNKEKEGREAKSEERWHYLAVKKLSTLLRGITSKYHSDFYYLNCLHSFQTENNLNLMKKYIRIKTFVELYCHQKRIIY